MKEFFIQVNAMVKAHNKKEALEKAKQKLRLFDVYQFDVYITKIPKAEDLRYIG
jgi:diketogulonate reductase-like aldo/keto reductase